MFTNITKKRTLATLIAVVLMLSAMLVSCGEKKIEDPAELFKYAEMKSLDAGLAIFADAYDEYLSNVNTTKAQGSATSIDINVSEEALGILELLAKMDLSWLSNIGIDNELYLDKESFTCDISLLLGESRLANLQMLMNKTDSSIYFAIPEVLTKAVKIVGDTSDVSLDLIADLPSGDTLTALVKKYVGIFVSGIEKVEKSDGAITANGITESCTVVKATLTAASAANIMKQMIETAKVDTELKELIIKLGDTLAQIPDAEIESGDALYGNLMEEFEWKLEDIEEYDFESVGEDEAFVITDYINSKNEIIGRAISNDTGEFIFYGTAEKDGSFCFELKVEEETVLRGEGKNGKTINGKFIIGDGVNDYAEITLTELDEKLTKGTIDVKLLEAPEIDGAEMFSAFLSVYSLRVSFDTSATKADVTLAVMNGDNEFASISINGEKKKVEKLDIPTEDVIIFDENLDTSALMGALDLSALIENIKNSPIPAEIVSLIELYMAMVG